jgi:hypothetical protein
MRKNARGQQADSKLSLKREDNGGIGCGTNPPRRTARIGNSGSASHQLREK